MNSIAPEIAPKQRRLVPHCWVSRDIGGDLWLPSTDHRWKCNLCCASGTLTQLATMNCGQSATQSIPSLAFNLRLTNTVVNNYPAVDLTDLALAS